MTWLLIPVLLPVAYMLSLLIHEFGHAVVALRLIDGEVTVATGCGGRQLVHLQCRRLSVAVGLGDGGECVHDDPGTSRGRALITAAGPAASLLTAAVACAAWLAAGGTGADLALSIALVSIAGSSLVGLLISLSFIEVEKGKPSDGLRLARELGFVEPAGVSLPPISLPTPLLVLLTVAGFAGALVALPLALAGVTGLAALGLRALDRTRPDGMPGRRGALARTPLWIALSVVGCAALAVDPHMGLMGGAGGAGGLV
ncbi:MAG TPA: hypothetical protein VGV67_01640, partial [Solirubrobacteraceae bacterium]|nr:hypothetical protein [Solirubrobacteraceae bacterium]